MNCDGLLHEPGFDTVETRPRPSKLVTTQLPSGFLTLKARPRPSSSGCRVLPEEMSRSCPSLGVTAAARKDSQLLRSFVACPRIAPTTPGPASARDSSAARQCCLPADRKGSAPGSTFFAAQYPAHRCLCLRFACRLATTGARLEVRMESLLLSCRDLSSPTTCRFIPAHSVPGFCPRFLPGEEHLPPRLWQFLASKWRADSRQFVSRNRELRVLSRVSRVSEFWGGVSPFSRCRRHRFSGFLDTRR